MEKIHVDIKGITCHACVKLVSQYIRQLDGVRDVQIKLNGSSSITADRMIDRSEIESALFGSDFELI